MNKQFYFIIFIFLPFIVCAQNDSTKWLPQPSFYYPFIDYDANTFIHPGKLDTVFKKLAKIKQQHKGRVNIVHIGDSHLQADMMTVILRTGFQDYFGDLGRGLIFPYQLANSNAPRDYTVTSNAVWKGNRMGIDKPVKTGICGFGIQTNKENACIRFHLKDINEKPQYFNRIVFLLGKDSSCYKLTDSNLKKTVQLISHPDVDTPSIVFDADSLLSGFELAKTDVRETGDFSFYGVSLERRDTCGVAYHTIGVNGARFDHYLENKLFWQQLKALHGDLFIVSLGTNEAQNPTINEIRLMDICDSMVKHIRKIVPKAIVLFTTPAGSYFKGKKPNASVQSVSHAIGLYCDEHDIPLWDLNHITDGATGTVALKKYNLLGHDLVHYTNLGYQLQGLLLLNAFADSYNQYCKRHPVIVKPKPKVVVEYVDKPKKGHR